MDLNMSSILSCWLASFDCSDVNRLKVVTDIAIDASVNKTNTALNLVLLNASFVLVGFTLFVAL